MQRDTRDELASVAYEQNRVRQSNALRDNRESRDHNQQSHHCFDLIHASDIKPSIILRADVLTSETSKGFMWRVATYHEW